VSGGALIEAQVVLDARNGPIYVGKGSVVQSGSRITGPANIGDETIIHSALIHEGCSIGNVCRVGGELENAIVQGFTNKHHLGYIGHAYVGEWVNIGAATTNSDLKNTYGTVAVKVNGQKVDTKKTKIGCFIGDHAKTSIGTQIYTGKKIGVASHVHAFITEDVPAFTLWAKSIGTRPAEIYLESAIQTQKRVFARRGVKQTKEDIELLTKLFSMTARERREAGVAKRRFEL
jgi:UDP-N-acetylglucosamine diphosphorylase/glucosamine-1-phosphate N-acetyltransferase